MAERQSSVPEELKRTNVRLPKSMHTKLRHLSIDCGDSVEKIVREAIETHLNLVDRPDHGSVEPVAAPIGLETATLEQIKRLVDPIEGIKAAVTEALGRDGQASSASASTYLDALPAATAIFDLTGRLTWCNSRFAYLAGAPRAELLGQTTQAIFNLEAEDPIVVHMSEALESGDRHESFETLTHQRGLIRRQTVLFPIYESNERYLGALYLAHGQADASEVRSTATRERVGNG